MRRHCVSWQRNYLGRSLQDRLHLLLCPKIPVSMVSEASICRSDPRHTRTPETGSVSKGRSAGSARGPGSVCFPKVAVSFLGTPGSHRTAKHILLLQQYRNWNDGQPIQPSSPIYIPGPGIILSFSGTNRIVFDLKPALAGVPRL